MLFKINSLQSLNLIVKTHTNISLKAFNGIINSLFLIPDSQAPEKQVKIKKIKIPESQGVRTARNITVNIQ